MLQSKNVPSVLLVLFCWVSMAQNSSEIILFDVEENGERIRFLNPRNISDNPGYDNQPCFTEDGMAIYFSSARESGQTDVRRYNLETKDRDWLTDTPGSEYSPSPIPGKKKHFTCVRLNEDETQFVYKYSLKNKPEEVLLPDLKVGYYLWFDQKTLLSFVIGDTETLLVKNFKYDISYPIQKEIGRSLCKIPLSSGMGPNAVSFISLLHEGPEIYSIDPKSSKTYYIADALPGSQDLAWTAKGVMLMGKDDAIYKWKPGKDKSWEKIEIENKIKLIDISRIAISPDGTKAAVVVGEE